MPAAAVKSCQAAKLPDCKANYFLAQMQKKTIAFASKRFRQRQEYSKGAVQNAPDKIAKQS